MHRINPIRKAFSLDDIDRYDSRPAPPYLIDERGKVEVLDEAKFRRLRFFREESMSDQPLEQLIHFMEADLQKSKNLKADFSSSVQDISDQSAPSKLSGIPNHWNEDPPTLRYMGSNADNFLRKQILYNRYSQKVGHVPTMYIAFSGVNQPPPRPSGDLIQRLKHIFENMKSRQCVTVVVPIAIYAEGNLVGHAEILLLENFLSEKVKVSRFDPNGEALSYWSTGSNAILDAFITDVFHASLGTSSWEWASDDGSAPSCPRVLSFRGPQSLARKIPGELGFCQVWILLFVDLRLHNPHESIEGIKSFFRNQTPAQLSRLIQNFSESANDPEIEQKSPQERHRQVWKEETLLAHDRLDDLTIPDRDFILSIESLDYLDKAFQFAHDVQYRRNIHRICNFTTKTETIFSFPTLFHVSNLLPMIGELSLPFYLGVVIILMGLAHNKSETDVGQMLHELTKFIQAGKDYKLFTGIVSELSPSTLQKILDGNMSTYHLEQFARFAVLKFAILGHEKHGIFSTSMLAKMEAALLNDETTIDFEDIRLKRILSRFKI